MKRWLWALLLLASTSPAWAQNPTCPTRPAGDNSNACASTAFVGTAVSNGVTGTTPIVVAPIVGGNNVSCPTCAVVPGGSSSTTVREVLTAARTYYVRGGSSPSSAGSDTNCNGLTDANDPGSGSIPRACAFSTWQKAVNVVQQTIDLGGQTVTIQQGTANPNPLPTTYSAGFSCLAPWTGAGTVQFTGHATPANVILSIAGNNAIQISYGCTASIQGFQLAVTSGSADALTLLEGGLVFMNGDMNFGSAGRAQINVSGNSRLRVQAAYHIIAGTSVNHIRNVQNAVIKYDSAFTITLSGSPVYSGANAAFVLFQNASSASFSSPTWSGSAGAPLANQCNGSLNATLLNPSSASLPGTAGTCSSGGGQLVSGAQVQG